MESSQEKWVLTERDLLRHVVCEYRDPGEVKLKDVMRTDPVTFGLRDSVESCLEKMKQKRPRYLLACEGREFIGVVSPRDTE
jgi:CBS domain-containing protein